MHMWESYCLKYWMSVSELYKLNYGSSRVRDLLCEVSDICERVVQCRLWKFMCEKFTLLSIWYLWERRIMWIMEVHVWEDYFVKNKMLVWETCLLNYKAVHNNVRQFLWFKELNMGELLLDCECIFKRITLWTMEFMSRELLQGLRIACVKINTWTVRKLLMDCGMREKITTLAMECTCVILLYNWLNYKSIGNVLELFFVKEWLVSGYECICLFIYIYML